MSTKFFTRVLPTIFVVFVLAAIAYAFAAANVVPETGAGDGAGTISGYTVTNVTYTTNAADPTKLDTVTFNINPTAGAGVPIDVDVQLTAAGPWFTCVVGVSPSWSCNLTGTGPTVVSSDNLRVVAAQ